MNQTQWSCISNYFTNAAEELLKHNLEETRNFRNNYFISKDLRTYY